MALSTNPFTVLSYVSGPALLTNATALMLLSTSNRFARAIDRSRSLVKYIEGIGGPRSKEAAAEELIMSRDRVRLIARALSRFYLATGFFALATMTSIAGAVLGEYIGGLGFAAGVAFFVLGGLFAFPPLFFCFISLLLSSKPSTTF